MFKSLLSLADAIIEPVTHIAKDVVTITTAPVVAAANTVAEVVKELVE